MKRRRSDVTSLLANGSAPSGKERDSGPRVFSCRFRTPLARRPCESRDPYAVPSRCGTESETFHNNERRWLWVPAFAGTTWEDSIVKQQTRLRAPRRDQGRVVAFISRPLEGVGNAGCPLHPQPRVQCVGSTRVFTTGPPGSPGIPARNGFNGLLRALP